jgi:hypothetical protein
MTVRARLTSRLIATANYQCLTTSAPVAFEHVKSETQAWGYRRFLSVGGKRAFELSFPCDTCQFLFERMEGASETVSVEGLAEQLRKGIDRIDTALCEKIAPILPAGQYLVNLLEITPKLVTPLTDGDYFSHEQVDLWGMDPFWGLPHYPKTEYYRGLTREIGDKRGFFEFVVPMMPKNWLQKDTWKSYLTQIDRGGRPTALSIAVLDTKQPSEWSGNPAINQHWCLAHFLLDGHHKMFAASQLHKPITLLSFLAVGESIAYRSEIDRAIRVLAE